MPPRTVTGDRADGELGLVLEPLGISSHKKGPMDRMPIPYLDKFLLTSSGTLSEMKITDSDLYFALSRNIQMFKH